jgi:hypothetical protein
MERGRRSNVIVLFILEVHLMSSSSLPVMETSIPLSPLEHEEREVERERKGRDRKGKKKERREREKER